MNNQLWKSGLVIMLVFGVLIISAGCSSAQQPAAAQTKSELPDLLRTDYEDALDVTNQLALGTLQLEETAHAVTEDQASTLLSLWQVLISGELESDSEEYAVTKQIVNTMTDAQIDEIIAMGLTQEDLTAAWMQDRGMAAPGGAGQGMMDGGAAREGNEDMAAMRENMQNMSEEERAEMRENMMAQMGDGSGEMPGGAGRTGRASGTTTSAGVYASVVTLLAEKAGEEMPTRPQFDRPDADEAEAETEEAEAEMTPEATPEPTATPEPEVEATPEPEGTEAEAEVEETDTAVVSEPVVRVAATAEPAEVETTQVVYSTAALTQVEDTDPGPPFSVTISQNTVEANPNYEGGSIYTVTGWVTNESDEVYVVQAVNVTFYDADGFRGSYNPFPRSRSGEYIWHGAMEAEISCNILGPGESCPFIAEIAASNMASFLVHTDADVVEWHEPASAIVSDTSISTQGSYYVIKGTVTNTNAYPIENILITGTFYNAAGEMTSMGSGYLVPALLDAGASAEFEVYVSGDYASYQVNVQAEGAFD